jgi:phage terminase large subunit-like protein
VIELDEKTVGIWFLATSPSQDFLAGICEIEPEKKYRLTYRFRLIKDDKVFDDSEDEKHWYDGTLTGTRNFVVFTFRRIVREMQQVSEGGELYELMMDERGPDDFIRRLQDMPFAYSRQIPARSVTV